MNLIPFDFQILQQCEPETFVAPLKNPEINLNKWNRNLNKTTPKSTKVHHLIGMGEKLTLNEKLILSYENANRLQSLLDQSQKQLHLLTQILSANGPQQHSFCQSSSSSKLDISHDLATLNSLQKGFTFTKF